MQWVCKSFHTLHRHLLRETPFSPSRVVPSHIEVALGSTGSNKLEKYPCQFECKARDRLGRLLWKSKPLFEESIGSGNVSYAFDLGPGMLTSSFCPGGGAESRGGAFS